MQELADIFEPSLLWAHSLVYIGLSVLCVCVCVACGIIFFRANPYKKALKSLDIADSKNFAFTFSALYPRALKHNSLAFHLAKELESKLVIYKFSPAPPPLSDEILSQYQKLCERV